MEKMTWEQMLDILGLLFKTLFKMFFDNAGVVKWDVSRETAQQIVKGDPESLAKQFLQFLANGGRVAGGLLTQITKVSVNDAKRFVASEHIKSANIGSMGDNFKKLFLNLVEEDVPEAKLAIHRLEENSKDHGIMTELGDRAKSKLAHFFELIEKQSRGEEGALLVNGCANIAYINDEGGVAWAVRAAWYSGYRFWLVEAYSVECPYEWLAGRQVLSSDS